MQYNASTPNEYLQQLDNDWRKEKLQQIREMILQSATDVSEGMEYKMLCYSVDGKSIFHLNAQKHYVSLYVGNIQKVENADNLLRGFDHGKGCIRVKKSSNITEGKLLTFIHQTLDFWRKGGNTDC